MLQELKLIILIFLALFVIDTKAGCYITTTPIKFGSYNTLSNDNADAAGTIEAHCEPVAAYTISLDKGANNSKNYKHRQMKEILSEDAIKYNLYIDELREVVWGDGKDGTKTVNTTFHVRKVYARAFPGQDVPVGVYSDFVGATLTF